MIQKQVEIYTLYLREVKILGRLKSLQKLGLIIKTLFFLKSQLLWIYTIFALKDLKPIAGFS